MCTFVTDGCMMHVRRWKQTSLSISRRAQRLGQGIIRQQFLPKQHLAQSLPPRWALTHSTAEKLSLGDLPLPATAYGWRGLWYSGQGQRVGRAGGSAGLFAGWLHSQRHRAAPYKAYSHDWWLLKEIKSCQQFGVCSCECTSLRGPAPCMQQGVQQRWVCQAVVSSHGVVLAWSMANLL